MIQRMPRIRQRLGTQGSGQLEAPEVIDRDNGLMLPFVVAKGETPKGPSLDIFGDQVTILISGRDTGGKYTFMHGVTPPKGGPPLHVHLTDSEVFHVLSGSFLFVLDGQRVEAEQGATVFIPAGVSHQYQNVGDEPGELFLFVEPAGLDDFFIELDALLKAGGAADMGAIALLHAKYRMDLQGPPLAAMG